MEGISYFIARLLTSTSFLDFSTSLSTISAVLASHHTVRERFNFTTHSARPAVILYYSSC